MLTAEGATLAAAATAAMYFSCIAGVNWATVMGSEAVIDVTADMGENVTSMAEGQKGECGQGNNQNRHHKQASKSMVARHEGILRHQDSGDAE